VAWRGSRYIRATSPFVEVAWPGPAPEELAAIVAALQESDAWIQQNYRAAAELFAADDGGDVDAWEHDPCNRPFGLHPVSEDFVIRSRYRSHEGVHVCCRQQT
jgi:hypothetical protein